MSVGLPINSGTFSSAASTADEQEIPPRPNLLRICLQKHLSVLQKLIVVHRVIGVRDRMRLRQRRVR